MMRFCLCVGVVVALAVAASVAVAQDVESLPKEIAQKIGKALTKAAAEIKKPQVKIEGDPTQAVGVAVRDVEGGVVLVPQMGLDEENAPDMTGKKGVPLGLLFCTSKLVPVIDGKLVDRDKLNVLTVTDGRGDKHEVNCIMLSVRQISEEDYRLYGFGKSAEPLIDVKFTDGEGPGAKPVALEIKEGEPALVVITVFGKYQATFDGGVVE